MAQQLSSHEKINLYHLLNQLQSDNLIAITQFLDQETLQLFHETTQISKQYRTAFIEISFVKYFLNKYLNCTDRSVYISFYSDERFITYQKQQTKNIWFNCYQLFLKADRTFNQIKNAVSKNYQAGQQIMQTIMLSLVDPFLPMTKLRRDNVAMHCNSSYQFYLADTRFPQIQEQFEQECFTTLKESLLQIKKSQVEQQNLYMGYNNEKSKLKYQLCAKNWHKISATNYHDFLIKQGSDEFIAKIQNYIVYLLVLFDTMIESYDSYIESLKDPIHKFAQFILRFSMFRNSILSLQKSSRFIFMQYMQFCDKKFNTKHIELNQIDIQHLQQRVFLGLCHCMMSKWYIHMQKHLFQFHHLYCHLLNKLNLEEIKSSLKEDQMINCEYLVPFINKLSMNQQYLLKRQFLVSIENMHDFMMQILQQSDITMQFVKQYLQFIMDMSVNQINVHWCGHSEQILYVPYQQYQQYVLKHFYIYFEKLWKICNQVDSSHVLFEEIINKVFYCLDKELLKPTTFKKLVNIVNSKWTPAKQSNTKCIIPYPSDIDSMHSLTSSEIIKNDGQNQEIKLLVQFSFTQQDSRIEFYNSQASIPFKTSKNLQRNIIIQNSERDSSLKKSSQTCETENKQMEEENQQILSFKRIMSYIVEEKK